MRQDENSTATTRRTTTTTRDGKPALAKPALGKAKAAATKTPLRARATATENTPAPAVPTGFKTPARPADEGKPARPTSARRPALSSIGSNTPAPAATTTPGTALLKKRSALSSSTKPTSALKPTSVLKAKSPLATPRTPLHQTTGYARAHPSAKASGGFTLKRIPESSGTARRPGSATPRAPVRSISVMMDDDEVGAVASAVDRPYAPPSPPASRKAAAMYAAVFPESEASLNMPPPPHDPFAGDDFTFDL